MIDRVLAGAAIILSCVLGGGSLGAEPGFPASLAGTWQMTKLACAGCSLAGALPPDLAGGTLGIGVESFDDPLAGACPEPRYAAEPSEPLSRFLEDNAAAALGPLKRLAPQNAPVIRVTVTCKPPAGARAPIGAVISLAFVPPDRLVRLWMDKSYIILRRSSLPATGTAAEK